MNRRRALLPPERRAATGSAPRAGPGAGRRPGWLWTAGRGRSVGSSSTGGRPARCWRQCLGLSLQHRALQPARAARPRSPRTALAAPAAASPSPGECLVERRHTPAPGPRMDQPSLTMWCITISRQRASADPGASPRRAAADPRPGRTDRARLGRPTKRLGLAIPAQGDLSGRPQGEQKRTAAGCLHRLAHPLPGRRCAAPRGGARPRPSWLAQRRHDQAAFAPQRDRDVVDRAVRLQLIEEPEPLLGEGQRQRKAPGRPGGSAAAAAWLGPAAPRSTRAASAATVGASNSARSGRSTPSDCAQPRHHLRGQQRVAAEIEEALLATRPARRPAPRPRSRPAAPPPTVRAVSLRSRASTVSSGAGSALRSTLPLGVSGSASRHHQGRGQHVLRQAPGAAPRAARSTPTPSLARRPRRPPGAGRPSVLPHHHHRSAHPGQRASAASISPSSMRKPRTFTWWSMRPRNSTRRPAGSAPGRRSGTAARRPRSRRIGHEPLRRQLRTAQVAPRQALAADEQLPRHAHRRQARRPRPARRPACWRSAGRSAPATPLATAGSIRWQQVKVVSSVGPYRLRQPSCLAAGPASGPPARGASARRPPGPSAQAADGPSAGAPAGPMREQARCQPRVVAPRPDTVSPAALRATASPASDRQTAAVAERTEDLEDRDVEATRRHQQAGPRSGQKRG